MKLRCFYCGHSVSLGPADDSYDGPLRCQTCKNVMVVRVERGLLRAMAPCPQTAPDSGPAGLDPSPPRPPVT